MISFTTICIAWPCYSNSNPRWKGYTPKVHGLGMNGKWSNWMWVSNLTLCFCTSPGTGGLQATDEMALTTQTCAMELMIPEIPVTKLTYASKNSCDQTKTQMRDLAGTKNIHSWYSLFHQHGLSEFLYRQHHRCTQLRVFLCLWLPSFVRLWFMMCHCCWIWDGKEIASAMQLICAILPFSCPLFLYAVTSWRRDDIGFAW